MIQLSSFSSTNRIDSYMHELRSHKAIVPCNNGMKTFVLQDMSESSGLCTLKVCRYVYLSSVNVY